MSEAPPPPISLPDSLRPTAKTHHRPRGTATGRRKIPKCVPSTSITFKHFPAVLAASVLAYVALQIASRNQRRYEERMWQNYVIPMVTGTGVVGGRRRAPKGGSPWRWVRYAGLLSALSVGCAAGAQQYLARTRSRQTATCQNVLLSLVLLGAAATLALVRSGVRVGVDVAERLPPPLRSILLRMGVVKGSSSSSPFSSLPARLLRDSSPSTQLGSALLLLGGAGMVSFLLRRAQMRHHASRHHRGHPRSHADVVPSSSASRAGPRGMT